MSIRVLSDQLASQIAAGEVVERPSSVVKELLENSLDAAATTINIDIREAGRKSIQIADNGVGISADELEIAFLRHATSKLQNVEGLNEIRTLGFRGEALAAIAAVSQLTIVSRAKGANSGTRLSTGIRLTMEGGKKMSRDVVGAPQGTVIGIDNLFFNVPARLKFLKSNMTEKRLIDELVTRYALAYPDVRFRLTHNGRITFQTSGNGNVRDVLLVLYGPEVARQLLDIEADGQQPFADGQQPSADDQQPTTSDQQPITLSGFVGPPSIHWSNRSHITFFVNGRWVKDNSLTYAVIQAYHTLLPTGRYPLGIVFLTLPPQRVDVNVHPSKTEVRFRKGKTPFSAVQRAVRNTLLAEAPINSMTAWSTGSMEAQSPGWEGNLDHDAFVENPQSALELDWGAGTAVPDSESTESSAQTTEGRGELPIMRVIGQVGAAYIITEGPDGLFLIDQHAAHSRVLLEELSSKFEQGQIPQQMLPSGTAVTLLPAQTTLLSANLERFSTLGFQIEPFGPNAFMVRAVPQLLFLLDPAQVVVRLMNKLEQQPTISDNELLNELTQMAAMKAGQTLTSSEMGQMIRQLEQCQEPLMDGNGRPTFIYLSVAQLAREFGRI